MSGMSGMSDAGMSGTGDAGMSEDSQTDSQEGTRPDDVLAEVGPRLRRIRKERGRRSRACPRRPASP